MLKVGAATAHPSILYNEEYFRVANESGIDAIEITRYAEDYEGLDYKNICRFAKEYDVELWSYHLPFYPMNVVNVTTADISLRHRTIEYYTDIMGRATDIGIDKFIVHPGNNFVAEHEEDEHIERSRETLDRIAEIAAGYGARVAVENMIPGIPGNKNSQIERILEANDKLMVCFDTNHLFGTKHTEFIERFADRLLTMHISDYDFVQEKHWLPGEGDIDWTELKVALDRIGYNGVWMYEVNLITPDTISRERPLTFRDLRENAECILSGNRPAPFGQRK